METFFNRFVFCLLLHLFAMRDKRPHADAYLTKTVKFGQVSEISVVLECLQQLQQNSSEVQPLYEYCNEILSKNFYVKKTKNGCFLS